MAAWQTTPKLSAYITAPLCFTWCLLGQYEAWGSTPKRSHSRVGHSVLAVGSSVCASAHQVGWASIQHGGWVPWVSVPKGNRVDSIPPFNITSQNHTASLPKYSQAHPDSRGGHTDPSSWWEECEGDTVRKAYGRAGIIIAILENTIYPNSPVPILSQTICLS